MEDIIIQAIQQKRLIEFYYHGLYRIAKPHVLGIKDRVKQVLVYQIPGQSRLGKLPNWRRINLREISRLRILTETFAGSRPFPSGIHSSWNVQIKVVR